MKITLYFFEFYENFYEF
jgi:hypothetical protein